MLHCFAPVSKLIYKRSWNCFFFLMKVDSCKHNRNDCKQQLLSFCDPSFYIAPSNGVLTPNAMRAFHLVRLWSQCKGANRYNFALGDATDDATCVTWRPKIHSIRKSSFNLSEKLLCCKSLSVFRSKLDSPRIGTNDAAICGQPELNNSTSVLCRDRTKKRGIGD